MFPRLAYLEWITGRPDVALYDLGSSDLGGDRSHELEVVPAPLDGLDDPPTGATLETQIAGEYGVEPEQVLVTAGATLANVIAVATALQQEAGEDGKGTQQVLVEQPSYEPLVKSPAALGADVNRFSRGDDFQLDPDRVKAAVTDSTALVTVTNRHNPSGALASRNSLAALADVVSDNGSRLLVDEVYAPYVPEPQDGPFGGPSAVDLENTVVTSSLTKFYGLDDLRIGWLIADEAFVDHARSVAYHFLGVADTSRALGKRALHNADRLDERSRTLLGENADLLGEFLDERDDLEGFLADGSPFAFLDPVNADGDEVTQAAWEVGLLVVPGRFFENDDRIRVSLGRSPSEVAPTLDKLGEVLDGFR